MQEQELHQVELQLHLLLHQVGLLLQVRQVELQHLHLQVVVVRQEQSFVLIHVFQGIVV